MIWIEIIKDKIYCGCGKSAFRHHDFSLWKRIVFSMFSSINSGTSEDSITGGAGGRIWQQTEYCTSESRIRKVLFEDPLCGKLRLRSIWRHIIILDESYMHVAECKTIGLHWWDGRDSRVKSSQFSPCSEIISLFIKIRGIGLNKHLRTTQPDTGNNGKGVETCQEST